MPVKPEDGKWERLAPALAWTLAMNSHGAVRPTILDKLGERLQANINKEAAGPMQEITWHAIAGKKWAYAKQTVKKESAFTFRTSVMAILLEFVHRITAFFS